MNDARLIGTLQLQNVFSHRFPLWIRFLSASIVLVAGIKPEPADV